MANAGRILIIPKGEWNSTTQYDALDMVLDGYCTWLAKKPSVGIKPSDAHADYWFKMTDVEELHKAIHISFDNSGTELTSRNVQGAIVELLAEVLEAKKSASDGKILIADAITEKKPDTAIDGTSEYDEMADEIRAITSGGGNAIPKQVLQGATFTNESGLLQEGTMPNHGADTEGLFVEVDGNQLASVFDYGFRDAEYDSEKGLSVIYHPLSEVNEATGFTDYKQAVVDGLQYSGLDVTLDTDADELEEKLLGAFTECDDMLPDLIASGITTTTGTWSAQIDSNGRISGTGGGYNNVTVVSRKAINFSDYVKLTISINNFNIPDDDNKFSIGLMDSVNVNGTFTKLCDLDLAKGDFELTLNVSGVSGTKYITFKSYLGDNYYYDLSKVVLV